MKFTYLFFLYLIHIVYVINKKIRATSVNSNEPNLVKYKYLLEN